ncbi:MAG: NADAR family protein [Alphaproteobacteria bacterium]|jgi:predicted NAD-dependent protein-ADP-ribosyltransferase YbiA (DUF1768 family)|nr:NADAR family protein [Alphaproteobacteria bacterium]
MNNTNENNIISNFIDKEFRFLSNSYPYFPDGTKANINLEVKYNGISFDCITTAYIASKSDDKDFQIQLSKMTPFEAKKMSMKGLIETKENWKENRIEIMRNLLNQKFVYNEYFKKLLLKTGEAELIAKDFLADQFWEIDKEYEIGEGKLGKELIQIREKLKEPPKIQGSHQKKDDETPLYFNNIEEYEKHYGKI